MLVTGATGFIGGRLVERLVESDRRVRVLVRRKWTEVRRRTSGTRPLESRFPVIASRIEAVPGDVTDRDTVETATAGADIIYHLAGYARVWAKDEREFFNVNGLGTRNVCDAARRHGVRRVVHVSTNLVEPGDAADRHRVSLTPYQRSKVEGERVVREFADHGGDAVIARPTRVYGPGLVSVANAVTRLIDLYRRGLFRATLATGSAHGNYVFVEDVIDGIILAAQSGRSGTAYLLGGEDATMDEFLDAIGDAIGKRRRVIPLPLPVARAVAASAEFLGRIGIEPLITRDWVTLFATDWPSDSARARDDFGYAPRGIREGIATTIQWLEQGRPPWHSV